MNIDELRTAPTDAALRVLLVEDHELLAQSLAFTLEAEGLQVDRAPLDSAESILKTARGGAYAMVLLDLDLGEHIESGLALIKPLQETGARVAMLTAATDRERLAECVEAGAIGVIPKTSSLEQLLTAVRDAIALGTLLSPGQRDDLIAELRRQRRAREERMRDFQKLTRREREVLTELMAGKSAEEIARDWVVSITTVRSQIRWMMQKLGVHSQVAAIGLARRAGWEPPER